MKKEEIEQRIKRTKQFMLPIFVSQAQVRISEELPKDIKSILETLLTHWSVYQKNLRRILTLLSSSSIKKEELKEIEEFSLHLENSIEEVEERMYILGRKIIEKLIQLEKILLEEKTKSFNGIHQEVCKSSFILLFTTKHKVDRETLKVIYDALNRVYSSLLLCEGVRQGLIDNKPKWIPTQSIFLYKELYSHCFFNLHEYLTLYKTVEQAIDEQNKVVIRIDKTNKICSEFLVYFLSAINGNAVIISNIEIYERFPIEEKIMHHEENIIERKKEIESLLEKEKRLIYEINRLSYIVGKEVKNIVNMERKITSKKNFSVIDLFSLFERIQDNIKEIEHKLHTYNRLVITSKKTIQISARLVAIKSLDFKYFMLEGELKAFQHDLIIIYNTSETIYKRHSAIEAKKKKFAE
ncbi:hypothetical protein NEFER03_2097 [Nematocida sp. LUAm3]|nr:hypothetical protein NEFER03_2097 [Nematocida sp. LUAm3]KAI5175651.1 hypothetical protein NEFER02_1538 [Nematocida sp. LUAm2]KAI5178557.1 hypothetical protein NEFER01_1693 [Nematocida sp. LUAm1]